MARRLKIRHNPPRPRGTFAACIELNTRNRKSRHYTSQDHSINTRAYFKVSQSCPNWLPRAISYRSSCEIVGAIRGFQFRERFAGIDFAVRDTDCSFHGKGDSPLKSQLKSQRSCDLISKYSLVPICVLRRDANKSSRIYRWSSALSINEVSISHRSSGVFDRHAFSESRIAAKMQCAERYLDFSVPKFRPLSSLKTKTRKIRQIRRKVAHFLAGVFERETKR